MSQGLKGYEQEIGFHRDIDGRRQLVSLLCNLEALIEGSSDAPVKFDDDGCNVSVVPQSFGAGVTNATTEPLIALGGG